MFKKAIDLNIFILIFFLLFFLISWFFFPAWSLNTICLSFSNGLVVLGLLMLMRTGLISFGHGMYYCLGGYSVAMCYNFLGITEAVFLVLISIIVSFFVSLILGFFVRKFRGIFFAMLNLALSMILFGIIVKSISLGSTDGFGIKDISYLGLYNKESTRLNLLSYFFILVTSGISMFCVMKYLNSPAGKMLDAIKENEIRSSYLGINVNIHIHKIYIISGVLASLGGALMVLLIGHITPEDTAYWTKSGEFVFVAILSGTANVFAPIVGSLFFEFIRSFALYYFPNTWQLIIGIILIIAIVYLPNGIGSLFKRKTR
ncbi:MAG: branched-chain amino acid ABC transporter permease [Rickettsiales bacterium]|nr:branched-chain amino acid ABC transporter permease [Rickettsiales bacterium]|tara:strand:+ start:271 stop:1218 length:948 start_codon:yes stop_codon:yes gene_type:complete